MHNENNYNKMEPSNNFKTEFGKLDQFLPNELSYEQKLNLLKNLLSADDLARFKWEKQHLNVCGLNKSDFKYFDYDDPYAKDQSVKCSICGKLAFKDQYGNGECKNCGWQFSRDEEELEKTAGISYPMLVTPTTAREQYKKGLPFKATFKEFVNGLYYYSEMLFEYKNVMYEVFFGENDNIILCSKDMQNEYTSRADFEANANIDGILLKDLWNDVSFAGFMYCG